MAEAGGGAVPSASSMPAVSLTTSIGTTNAGENKYFLFNGGNYPEWKFQTLVYVMKILMVAESDINMIDIINGTSEPPTVGPKVAEYKKLNAHLFFHLVSTIKQEYQQYVRNVPMLDGVAAFRAMIASYEPHSKAAAKQLLKKLLLSLTQSGKTMTVFVANIVEMMGKLKAIIAETNIDLFEALMILILLDGMDPEHGILREQLLLDDNITFTAASAACIKKAEIVSYERFADDTTVQAKAATATDNYCATCFKAKNKKLYHSSENCFVLHPEKMQQFLQKKQGGKNGKHQRLQNSNNNSSQRKGGNASAAQQQPSASAGEAWRAQALAASTTVAGMDKNEDVLHKTFELDSCAYPTFVTNDIGVKNIDPAKRLTVSSCGPAVYKTEGSGIIGEHLPTGPMEVHVARQFRNNLLSVAQVCDKGRHVIFTKEGFKITNPAQNDKVEYEGLRSGNSYQLKIRIKPPTYAAAVASGTNLVEQPVTKSLAGFNVQTKIRLWHQRFPHPSAARLYEAIHGGHILGTGIPKDTPCVKCLAACTCSIDQFCIWRISSRD